MMDTGGLRSTCNDGSHELTQQQEDSETLQLAVSVSVAGGISQEDIANTPSRRDQTQFLLQSPPAQLSTEVTQLIAEEGGGGGGDNEQRLRPMSLGGSSDMIS